MMFEHFRARRRNRSRGQGMVEFALAFPIFLVLVIGIMEFGRLFITYTSVYAAAREGARYGAAVDNLCNDQIEAEAERAGFIAGDMTVDIRYEIYSKDLQWVSGDCEDAKAGDRVIVTASVPFTFVTGFMPGSAPLTVSSTAKRTIIKDVYLEWTLAPAATTDPDFTPGPETTTPDETLTETATEIPACSAASITGWTSGTSPYTVTLYNSGATPYDLTSVIVYWDREGSDLVQIDLSGESVSWTGLIEDDPATIDLTTYGWEIENGEHYMTLTFSGFNNAQFKGVEINLTAADGTPCTIP